MKSIALIASLIALTVAPVPKAHAIDPDYLRSNRVMIDLLTNDWTPEKGYELARKMEAGYFGKINYIAAEMLYIRGIQCSHQPSIERFKDFFDDLGFLADSLVINTVLFQLGLTDEKKMQVLSSKVPTIRFQRAWKLLGKQYRKTLKKECLR